MVFFREGVLRIFKKKTAQVDRWLGMGALSKQPVVIIVAT